ncbi:MAG: hypothetical protein IJW63_07305 [Lachnospiraceae bacterium]|nr:hypothetical protein [Lachnospiraceae bacterium]
MWSESAKLLRDFAGEGMILTLFFLSVIWLLITEKRKEIRIVFVYMPATILVVFLFPLTAKIMSMFMGEEIYYRLLWLWPIVPTIAYATVQLWKTVKEQSRLLVVLVISAIIVISGKLMYVSPNYSVAENQYHIPQVVVDICDDIRVEGRELRVLFPRELVQYVRQYDATVCLPYGREVLVYSWGVRNGLFYVMETQPIDVKLAAEYAREDMCHYVIIRETDELQGDFEDYDYELFGVYDEYLVYKDTTMYFGLWDEE